MSSVIRLPHGSVPLGSVKDPSVREALMKLNENIAKLLSAVSDLKSAVDKQAEGA